MLRVLPALVEIGLLLYCLIDCIQAPDGTVRNLPKWGWIILIILVPWIGPIAYLIAGRPRRDGTGAGRPWATSPRPGQTGYRQAPRGPDDDPDFLRDLNRKRPDEDRGPDGEPGDQRKEPPAPTS
ncbi:MAG: PLD nuclease N-terminal domain-containing protein [Actinomycetales bacterium]